MTIPLRNRVDLKAAGRSMATEAVDALAQDFATLAAAELEDESRLDIAAARMVDAAVSVARTYLDAGIPAPWVKAFLSAFHRTAVDQLARHSLATRPAAGTS